MLGQQEFIDCPVFMEECPGVETDAFTELGGMPGAMPGSAFTQEAGGGRGGSWGSTPGAVQGTHVTARARTRRRQKGLARQS